MIMREHDRRAEPRGEGARGLLKAVFSFSWATSLFGLRQFGGVLAPGSVVAGFDHVARASEAELDEPVRNFFRVGDRLQRETVDVLCGNFSPFRANRSASAAGAGAQPVQPSGQAAQPPGQAATATPPAGAGAGGSQPPRSPDTPAPARPAYRVNSGRLDTTSFVVLGDGLAAGMGDFTMSEDAQRESFPAQMARQMQTEFRQPLFQAPGLCYPVGFARPPVLVPQPLQTTIFDRIPPAPVSNLSVPGFRLKDALELRPAQPLIRRDSHKLTALNLTLGVLHFARGEEGPPPSQLEC